MNRRDTPIGETALEQALLDAGRSYGASSRARARTLAALGLAGSAATGVAAAAADGVAAASVITRGLAAKAGAGGAFVKVAAGVVLAGALAAIPVAYAVGRRHPLAPAPGPADLLVAPPVSRTAPLPSSGPAAAVPAAPPPGAGAVPTVAAAPARPRGEHAGGVRAAPRDLSLTEELLALDAARSALVAGDAGRALALLDAYGRGHQNGRLAMEAEILRIDAFAQSGRGDIARRRAALFVRRHPKSVLAPRARGFLAD